jgi:hypothetical protein
MLLDCEAVSDDTIRDEVAIPNFAEAALEIPQDVPSFLTGVLRGFDETFSVKPGKTTVAEHRIRVTDSTPVKVPVRRLPMAFREEVQQQLQTMLDQGIIVPSNSPYMAPCVFALKKSGEVRICVDYRELNKKTVKDAYPLPLPDEIQERLQGDSVFSTLDLRSGYWQLPVALEDQHKTAFCPGHDFGLFEFRRMPFGLTGAPASFQKMMNEVFRDLHFVCVYLDDILIHSKSEEEHVEHVRMVLQRLKDTGMTVRGSKCVFGKHEVRYLGHIYSRDGVKPEPEKISAVFAWQVAKNGLDVQKFTGLTNYYRRFVPGYADIAAPLHRLTQKKEAFVWNSEAEKAFNQLKEKLCHAPVLQLPQRDKVFEMAADASDLAIGAVVEQEGKPVAYASRLLRGAELKYSVIEKECLALVYAMKQFRHYLIGRRFTVFTDHRALQWLGPTKTILVCAGGP